MQRSPSPATRTGTGPLASPALACEEPTGFRGARGGIEYLAATQAADGFWNEPRYTATGFPRVFYQRYHGYQKFFPLWALARYRNLQAANSGAVAFGM